MKRLVIFVEGGTEQAFVEKALIEIAGKKNLGIDKSRLRGGGKAKSNRTMMDYSLSSEDQASEYFASIVDCGCDNRVRSDIDDCYDKLCENFDVIVGIRDAFGKWPDGRQITYGDVPVIRKQMRYRLRTAPIDPIMVLVVMEIEAWFIAECTHFSRIDSGLTIGEVTRIIGFDPITNPKKVEEIPNPASRLNDIYNIAGQVYEKTPLCIQRTIDALDCAEIYLNIGNKIPSLAPLITVLDNFLS